MEVDSEYTKEFVYTQIILYPDLKQTRATGETSGTTDEPSAITEESPRPTKAEPGDTESSVKDVSHLLPVVTEYTRNVVNDRHAVHAIVYKATCNMTSKAFVVHFYLFKEYTLDSADLLGLRDRHVSFLDSHGLKLHKERVLEQVDAVKRKPVYTGEESEQGWDNIPGENCFNKFLNWWLIVPKVQWDFFNLLYQMYTFDITHQGFLPKFVHFFTIPTNVMLSMMFLAQFDFFGVPKQGYGAFELNAALIPLIILVAMYILMGIIRKTVVWGFATSIVCFVCWVTGNLWYSVYGTPGNPWYNSTSLATNPLLWSYIISFIQASSHMCVPQLPPYITGVEHWESLHAFFCQNVRTSDNTCKSVLYIAVALLCFPVLSVAVAWFSWPRLIGTEIIYIMAGIGYQHSSFTQYFRVVEKAELTGNPGLDSFPRSADELEQPNVTEDLAHSDLAVKMKRHGIVKDNATTADVAKSVCAMKLAVKYFKAPTKPDDTHYMKMARKHLSR